jgi:hypothetical protein
MRPIRRQVTGKNGKLLRSSVAICRLSSVIQSSHRRWRPASAPKRSSGTSQNGRLASASAMPPRRPEFARARHIAQEFEANAYGSSLNGRTSRMRAAGRFQSRQGVAPGGIGATRFPVVGHDPPPDFPHA